MKKFITSQFEARLFILLSLTFILFVIVGTLTHECGHYIAARLIGDDRRIHYDYFSQTCSHNKIHLKSKYYPMLIRLGGVIQTVVTGTIGLFLLFVFRKSFYHTNKLNMKQWLLIFITLFWSRELMNLTYQITSSIITGAFQRGDEWTISRLLFNQNGWTLPITAGAIAALIISIAIFKFIPLTQRFTFILSGIIGGTLGLLFWLVWIGKYILP